MKKPSNNPEQPDLADAPFRLPDRERADWMPEPLEVIESIVDDLRQPTRELLYELDHDRERAFDLVRASSELYRHAEEMLQMVRDATESPDEFLAIGQLTYRFERALSYLNSLIGGLIASPGPSYVDVIHLKRDLQLVWSVLREFEKKAPQSSPKPTPDKVA